MKGRIGRIEFLMGQALTAACILGSIILEIQMSELGYVWVAFPAFTFVCTALFANLCYTLKRVHDLYPSVNPWLLFIPIYNLNIFLILLVTPGKKGINQYGLSPYALKRKGHLKKTQDIP